MMVKLKEKEHKKINKISRMWIGKSKGRRKNGMEYIKKSGFLMAISW